jgi:hypothetical protein
MDPITIGLISAAAIGGASKAGGGQVIGALAGSKSDAGKAYKKQIGKDITALDKGHFGMTAVQKQEAMKSAVRAAQGATAEQTASLQAQRASMGGIQSGQMASQLAGVGTGVSTGAALASADIEKASQALAAQQHEAALARVRAHRDKVQEDWAAGARAVGGALEEGGQAGLDIYGDKLSAGMGAAGSSGGGK